MLEVSTVRSPSKADQHARFPTSESGCGEDSFMVDDDNLLDYIDFTCCGGDVPSFFDILPDLEADPAELILSEFKEQNTVSPACRHGGAAETKQPPDDKEKSPSPGGEEKKEQKRLLGEEGQKKKNGGDDVLSAVTMEDSAAADSKSSSASAEGQSKKKTKPSKNPHGNKKKVDWTPELHRRFVQAVEQLGIDKAVPSRILEIMGMECLTRHNIASHLQKYRSHRKHLMAREAERQMYAAAAAATGGQVAGAAPRTKGTPAAGPSWVVAPTIGFPPPFGRPLHVWGHPPTAVEAAAAPMLPVWPRHLAPPRPLPPPWAPVVVDPASAYWHQQYNNAARKWGPQAVTQGTPCVPPPAMFPRFPAPPPVPGMMPHPMYRPIIPPPPQSSKLASLQLQLDAHPSKESIDAAIGDVLVKPWLPLPLGLKPPSLDSVMSELHKQGIPKVPPPVATNGS